MAVNTDYTFIPLMRESAGSARAETKDNTALGKDDFLKLLVAQLQYQNPLEPMDNTEYISQMASFSALEQMANLNTSFEKMASVLYDKLIPLMQWQQSAQVLGKKVSYLDPSAEEGMPGSLTGVVESVLSRDGQIYLLIDGVQIAMDSVTQIWDENDLSEDEADG